VTNIIIIGRGFIGSYLKKHLATSLPEASIHNISRADVDYFNEIKLKKYLRETSHFYDGYCTENVLINCSGFTGKPNVDECELKKEECFEYNVKLPIYLSHFCSKNKYWLINVSSGCIYTGYQKEFTEEDEPNFGFYNPESSFYSKCKHLAEKLSLNYYTSLLRIRMPFCGYSSPRNLLTKLLNYNNLVKFKNSLTSIDDFSDFVSSFIDKQFYKTEPGIYNVVNPGGMDAEEITQVLSKHNLINKNWKFVNINDLNLKAGRSNCVLSTEKITSLGLSLPSVHLSLDRCAQMMASNESV
jgi:dTDP-4-dehydrorhamnose reductase